MVDRVDRAEERLLGTVPEDAFENRLEYEAAEDDRGQADEARDREPLAPKAPPDERAVPGGLAERGAAAVERRRRGISSAVAQRPT
jgi:hypothetical protein